jgi:hypothetical protein
MQSLAATRDRAYRSRNCFGRMRLANTTQPQPFWDRIDADIATSNQTPIMVTWRTRRLTD